MSGSYPQLSDSHLQRGYGTSQTDFAQHASGNPTMSSPLSQSAMQHQGAFNEDFDASQRGSSLVDGGLNRSSSRASTLGGEGGVSRSNTLKKRASVKRSASLKRSSSKRSLKAGSLKGFGGVDSDSADFHSFSFTPVPTTGTPTEILANRFQAWRQLLKSLITYFREIQTSYETRAKALHKVQNTISNITHPAVFMSHDGLGEATRILDAYHKRSIAEASKSREIENDVIGALTGLRSDLGQKIKEIKSLSGDFKNSVEKEKDNTRREVEKLQEALQHADHEDAGATGKNDPFVVRLGVDRAIERQIDEENYLHRAYLNLESSGRELESIVVGEIQKAYNALAGILKREGDDAYNAVESLRSGPISMPKDQEWYQFVTHDPHFVDPSLPLRKIEEIEYPGKHHPSATEIRSGMLERKSKYLKSYTPGWYVLSPTHLHEFKSADKIYTQPPVMSLYLLDQKLGSRSEQGSSSNKFMLKGKQSGGMHKGHNWVFRAESYDTMMAWYNDIRVLTEKTGAERTAFVRKHARSVSGTSDRGTVSSDGDMEDDEADRAPYAADVTSLAQENPIVDEKPRRPAPGGRFPSDLVLRKTGTMSSTNDGADDSDDDQGVIAATGAIHGSRQEDFGRYDYGGKDPYRLDDVRTEAGTINDHPGVIPQQHDPAQQRASIGAAAPAEAQPVQTQTYALPTQPVQPINQQQQPQSFLAQQPATNSAVPQPEQSLARQPTENYGNWFGGAAVGAAGVGAGVLGAEAYRRHQNENTVPFAEQAVPHEEERGLANDPQVNATAFAANNTSALEPQYAGGAASLDAVTMAVPAAGMAEVPAAAPVAGASGDALPVGSSAANPQGLSSEPALGGLEARGAHETGQFFPKVVRHDTNLSISALHVPGEFPKRI